MKTRLVLWGTNANDEKVLVAIALRSSENKVDVWTIEDKLVDDALMDKMMKDWRNGKEVDFPESNHFERPLSASESILPDEIKVDKTDLINRAQTEWHFVVLSGKLHDVYISELGELKEQVSQLSEYSSDAWNDLKSFWNKVQNQIREKNLFREHANSLRETTNGLFSKMKELRATLDEEFRHKSKEYYQNFMDQVDEIEKKLEAGSGTRLSNLFNELKDIQAKFRDTKLTKEHRSKVWDKIDAAFKAVKQKRFGDSPANTSGSAMTRLTRRYDGLIAAINKMQQSISRDEKEKAYQENRQGNAGGQLEAQLREAKMKMIEERINSKKEKLLDMNKTKLEIEKKIELQKQRDAKDAERAKIEAAKAAAKAKIAEEIKSADANRDTEKLKEAAAKIVPATAVIKEEVSDDDTSKKEDVSNIEAAVDTVKTVSKITSEEE